MIVLRWKQTIRMCRRTSRISVARGHFPLTVKIRETWSIIWYNIFTIGWLWSFRQICLRSSDLFFAQLCNQTARYRRTVHSTKTSGSSIEHRHCPNLTRTHKVARPPSRLICASFWLCVVIHKLMYIILTESQHFGCRTSKSLSLACQNCSNLPWRFIWL